MAIRKPLVMISGVIQEIGASDSLNIANVPSFGLIKKIADQSKASNTTLANDDTLFFSMAANTKYSIRIRIFGVAPATPGFKYQIVGPASPTLVLIETATRAPAGSSLTVSGTTASAFPAASTAITGNATSHFFLEIDVVVQNGVNAGTFAFQWAQNASNATASIVRAGSHLEYQSF
jgi:hypothetical protein